MYALANLHLNSLFSRLGELIIFQQTITKLFGTFLFSLYNQHAL
jgi:hypothetical protein